MSDTGSLYVLDEPAWVIDATSSPIGCIDYSSDGSLVAFSNRPGCVFVVSSYDGTLRAQLDQSYSNYIVSGIKFHPNDNNLLLVSTRDGYVFLFEVSTGNIVKQTRYLGSTLTSATIDLFGESFVISCSDGSLRIFDLNSFSRTKVLMKVIGRAASAQNIGIQAMMFHPDDTNIILSAVSNDRILIWDVRSGASERTILGPHIRGPGLDMYDGTVITASFRERKQIEVWDFGSCRKMNEIQMKSPSEEHECLATSVRVARCGLDFIAGCDGCNLAQAYNHLSGQYIGGVNQFSSAVTAVAISPFGSSFVVGTNNGDGVCHMIRLNRET